MTNKRKIEIIDMVLDWFEKNHNKFYINCLDNDAQGICIITSYYLKLTRIESEKFNNYIMSATKRRWKYSGKRYKGYAFGNFIFKPGNIKPRINYLNRLKKKLSEN